MECGGLFSWLAPFSAPSLSDPLVKLSSSGISDEMLGPTNGLGEP